MHQFREAGTRVVLCSAFFLVLAASAVHAQPTDDCTGAQLTGASTLPFNGNFVPSNLAFNLSGVGCVPPAGFAPDSVVCFVPTSSCTVNFTCTYSGGNPPTGGSAVNVRDLGGGACAATPGPCVAGANATASPVSVSNVSLVGGTNYCFICNSPGQVPGDNQVYSITTASGNCGALPVEATRFSIEPGR